MFEPVPRLGPNWGEVTFTAALLGGRMLRCLRFYHDLASSRLQSSTFGPVLATVGQVWSQRWAGL